MINQLLRTRTASTLRRKAIKVGFRILRPEVHQSYRQAVTWEKLPNSAVKKAQLEKLNKVLQAHLSRDWFRAFWEANGGPPLPLESLEEFKSFSGTTRTFLAEHHHRVAQQPEVVRELSTSGSSGQNLFFHHSQEMVDGRTAIVRRCNQWVGFDNWGAHSISVWGLSPDASLSYLAKTGLKRFVLGTEILSAYGMDDAKALEFARTIVERQPVAVNAYPSYLAQLARVALDAELSPLEDTVVTWGGEQALDQDLETIRAFFGNRVYGRYGSQEFGTIAHQVPWRNGYVVAPTRFLLDNDSNGELVVTDLDNRATPFLRYKIGDAGTVEEIDADDEPGRQVITHLEGRSHDRITTPNGRLLPGQFWTLLSRVVPGIIAYQVAHRPPTEIRMRAVVDDEKFPADGPVKIAEHAEELLKGEMDFAVEVIDELERTDRGKRRFIVRLPPLQEE